MVSNFCCFKCNRTFFNTKGIKTHERNHKNENSKLYDDEYKTKRIANTRSVQMHRQLNPKRKFEDLEADTNKAIKEAEKFEQYLRDQFGLYILSYEEKLKDYKEANQIFEIL